MSLTFAPYTGGCVPNKDNLTLPDYLQALNDVYADLMNDSNDIIFPKYKNIVNMVKTQLNRKQNTQGGLGIDYTV